MNRSSCGTQKVLVHPSKRGFKRISGFFRIRALLRVVIGVHRGDILPGDVPAISSSGLIGRSMSVCFVLKIKIPCNRMHCEGGAREPIFAASFECTGKKQQPTANYLSRRWREPVRPLVFVGRLAESPKTPKLQKQMMKTQVSWAVSTTNKICS